MTWPRRRCCRDRSAAPGRAGPGAQWRDVGDEGRTAGGQRRAPSSRETARAAARSESAAGGGTGHSALGTTNPIAPTTAIKGELGQELPPGQMEEIIRSIGRIPFQRTTLYQPAPEEQRVASFRAAELQPIILTPSKRYARVQMKHTERSNLQVLQ